MDETELIHTIFRCDKTQESTLRPLRKPLSTILDLGTLGESVRGVLVSAFVEYPPDQQVLGLLETLNARGEIGWQPEASTAVSSLTPVLPAREPEKRARVGGIE
jgi:hypothetical protein